MRRSSGPIPRPSARRSLPGRPVSACRCGPWRRFEQARGPAMISSENGLLLATVLLNVQGRDVGGFVDEARAAVARDVTLPAGYYLGWSGRYENQARARQRLQIVMPIVLARHLHPALLHLRVAERSRARVAGGALRPHRRRLSALAPWLQLLGRRLGGLHRALRDGRADGRRDGDLSRRSGRPKAGGAWRRVDAGGAARGRQGRRVAAAAAQGDDRIDRRRRPAADHVEHRVRARK